MLFDVLIKLEQKQEDDMRKIKLLLATLCCSALVLSGCSTDVNKIIGNVSEKSLKESSPLFYNGKVFTEEDTRMYLTVAQFQTEEQLSKSGKLVEGYWESNPNTATKNTVADDLKNTVIDNMKTTLALYAHADDYGVKLTKVEEDNLLDSTRRLLGQTYKNLFVEFFKLNKISVDEDKLMNFTSVQTIAQNVSKKGPEAETISNEVKHAIKFNQIVIPVGEGKALEEAKATAEKIKEKISKGVSAADAAKEYSVAASIEYLGEGEKSILAPEDVTTLLSTNKGETKVFELKQNNQVRGYIVANVSDIDTDEAKKVVGDRNSQAQKIEAFTKKLNQWKSEITVNEKFFKDYKFVEQVKFWNNNNGLGA